MKTGFIMMLCALVLQAAVATSVFAEPPVVKDGDTIANVLEGYKGKRVTIRLQGGEELTGKVRFISKELLHLGELTKREYFDAVIELAKVEAVILQVKE